ncbi:uncharacterized protein LOC135471330 isoform X2 [Liolophura sinensis]
MTPVWYNEASRQPYFHDYFENLDQVDRLAVYACRIIEDFRGVFFLRPSLTDPQALTLTVVLDCKNFRHFRVSVDRNKKFVCCNGRHEAFPHISALVDYHRRHSFHEPDGALSGLKLTSAILRKGITEDMLRHILRSENSPVMQVILTPFQDTQNPTTMPITSIFEVVFKESGAESSVVSVTKLPSPSNNNRPQHVAMGERPSHGSETRVPEGRAQKVDAGLSLRQKIPPPVAPRPTRRSCHVFDCANTSSGGEGNIIYSEPIPSDRNRVPDLIFNLRLDDKRHAQRCHCGILIEESVMPLNWTLHRDIATGNVFFQNVDGSTLWDIPDEIKPFLTESQGCVIQKYK